MRALYAIDVAMHPAFSSQRPEVWGKSIVLPIGYYGQFEFLDFKQLNGINSQRASGSLLVQVLRPFTNEESSVADCLTIVTYCHLVDTRIR